MQQSTIPKEGILTGILSLGYESEEDLTMVKFSVSEQGWMRLKETQSWKDIKGLLIFEPKECRIIPEEKQENKNCGKFFLGIIFSRHVQEKCC